VPTVQKIYDSTYIQTTGVIITLKMSSFGNKISQAVSNYYRHVPLLMIWRQHHWKGQHTGGFLLSSIRISWSRMLYLDGGEHSKSKIEHSNNTLLQKTQLLLPSSYLRPIPEHLTNQVSHLKELPRIKS
jgi:hypothetical protein